MKKRISLLVVLSLFSVLTTSVVCGAESDLAILTRGVDSIAKTGAPGPIVSFGENSFPVALGEY